MDIKLIKCPKCDFTMKEPTLIQGKHTIVGHTCNGFEAPNRLVGEDTPMDQLTKVVAKKNPNDNFKKLTDRQLSELQAQTLIEISKNTTKTYSILNFFFWVYIIGFVLWLILSFVS